MRHYAVPKADRRQGGAAKGSAVRGLTSPKLLSGGVTPRPLTWEAKEEGLWLIGRPVTGQ